MASKKNQRLSDPKKPIRDLAPKKLSEVQRQGVKGGKPAPGKLNFEHYFDKSS
jgi:hypothetical protein